MNLEERGGDETAALCSAKMITECHSSVCQCISARAADMKINAILLATV